MALVLYANGKVEKVTGEENLSLDKLQEIVGGYIEHLSINMEIDFVRYTHLICNEEGKLIGLDMNVIATAFVQKMGYNDAIAGNVILMEPGEIE